MLVKEVKPINFIYYRTETTIDNLINIVPVAKDVYKEAALYNLHVTGPLHWHYADFSGDADKPFVLEVALPVSEVLQGYDGKFHFKRTEPFKCVSVVHEGNWNEIPGTYNKLMQFIKKNRMEASLLNRELYINADFQHPDANVTEIQMGIC
jgi:effector-binding domain-containing protein